MRIETKTFLPVEVVFHPNWWYNKAGFIFDRDYFFDLIDMMRDQYYAIAVYPRLSFGPGQRYASKGCYVVQLSGGPEPQLEKRSGWVVH